MSSKRAATSRTVRNEDAERSVADWKTLDLVSLRLKCNHYSLVEKGVKETLAKRLHAHFEDDRRRLEAPTDQRTDNLSRSESETDETSDVDPSNTVQITLSDQDIYFSHD